MAVQVLGEGSLASGYVSQATPAARRQVEKGRGRVAVRFTRITPAGHDQHYAMQTRSWVGVAPATKKQDAMKIGLPAAGGAIVGGIVGAKRGGRYWRAGRRRRRHGRRAQHTRQGSARRPRGFAECAFDRAVNGYC